MSFTVNRYWSSFLSSIWWASTIDGRELVLPFGILRVLFLCLSLAAYSLCKPVSTWWEGKYPWCSRTSFCCMFTWVSLYFFSPTLTSYLICYEPFYKQKREKPIWRHIRTVKAGSFLSIWLDHNLGKILHFKTKVLNHRFVEGGGGGPPSSFFEIAYRFVCVFVCLYIF